jgi:hypothetical protein
MNESKQTAICLWIENTKSNKYIKNILDKIKNDTGSKTLDYFICGGKTIVILNKKEESNLIPNIYNGFIKYKQTISIFDNNNNNPICFNHEKDNIFTKEEYLKRYTIDYNKAFNNLDNYSRLNLYKLKFDPNKFGIYCEIGDFKNYYN